VCVCVQHSKCRDDFLNRLQQNDAIRKQAKEQKQPVPLLKRLPQGPRPGHFVSVAGNAPQVLAPLKYELLV
jgi:large subunit ribosomal protein L21e